MVRLGHKARSVVVYAALSLLVVMAIWSVAQAVLSLSVAGALVPGELVLDFLWGAFLVGLAVLLFMASQRRIRGRLQKATVILSSILVGGAGLLLAFLLYTVPILTLVGLAAAVIGMLLPSAMRDQLSD